MSIYVQIEISLVIFITIYLNFPKTNIGLRKFIGIDNVHYQSSSNKHYVTLIVYNLSHKNNFKYNTKSTVKLRMTNLSNYKI